MLGDGATVRRMPLVNVLVSTPNEPCAVVDIVDCTEHMNSGGKKDASYIADMFSECIEELDPDHSRLDVIIFDGASNVQKAGRLIEARYPKVSVLHGAEHVVSLFFSDVARLPLIKKVIIGYRRVYRVFGSGSMHAPYAMFQKQASTFNGGRKIGLLRPSETRMAGFFLAFHRFLRLRLALMATLSSAEYKRLKLTRRCVQLAEKFLEDDDMWNGLFVLVRCLFPPLRVLRLADKQSPGMDQIHYFVRKTDVALQRSVQSFSQMSFFDPAVDTEDDNETVASEANSEGATELENDHEANAEFEAVIAEAYDSDSDSDNADGDTESDEELVAGLPTGIDGGDLGQNIMQLWKKRRPKLVSDFAVAGWLLCPLEQVRRDVGISRSGSHNEAMDRVLTKLLNGNNEEEMGKEKDTFWTEWEMFHNRNGAAYGPTRKYIWNSELLRRRESAKWHAQYSVPFTKVSLCLPQLCFATSTNHTPCSLSLFSPRYSVALHAVSPRRSWALGRRNGLGVL
jgi:hypothetical protein